MAGAGPSLQARAIRYLARREYSRAELEKKLLPYAGTPDELALVLDSLEQTGFLSARRVVGQVVQIRRKRYGSRRITQELREKGIDEELIAAVLPELRETELEAAREVWRKKFDVMPSDARERGRQVRFMLGRGFGMETICQVLAGSQVEEPE